MILKMWPEDMEKRPLLDMLPRLEDWIEKNLKDDIKLRDGEVWMRPLIKYKNSCIQRLKILKDIPKLRNALKQFEDYLLGLKHIYAVLKTEADHTNDAEKG
jgi:hypothetical protein